MRWAVKLILALNLAIIAVLAFAFPHLMISPGELIEGHATSETDCFACHDLFLGAAPEKCVTCHKVADIGVLTTKGTALVDRKTKVPFGPFLALASLISLLAGQEIFRWYMHGKL